MNFISVYFKKIVNPRNTSTNFYFDDGNHNNLVELSENINKVTIYISKVR